MDISRGSDDSGRRWYSDGHSSYMSVTTILDYLDEDTSGLEWWRRNNQGNGDDFHWEHIFWMSGPRGTLCHWRALQPLADEPLWGEEEQAALDAVADGPDDGEFDSASHGMGDIAYSTLKNKDAVDTRDEFEPIDVSLASIVRRDTEWVADTFEDLRERLGITRDSVIAVEQYLLDDKYGYGGQCDLVYEDPNGDVVVADLKTSSSFRQDHRLQPVAYAKAVERDDEIAVTTVDRMEVIRMSPDNREYNVYGTALPEHVDADAEWYDTDAWLVDEYGDFEYESVDEMWKTFRELINIAHEQANDDRAAD